MRAGTRKRMTAGFSAAGLVRLLFLALFVLVASRASALHVLAYNLKRVMSIIGIAPLIAAIKAWAPLRRKLRPYPAKTPITTTPAGR